MNIKTIQIPTIAPTCFGSRRNHHQGVILWLPKTINMVLYARSYWRDQCHGGIPACCASVLCVSDCLVCRSGGTGIPSSHLHRLTIPDDVLIQFDLLMMSAVTLETFRGMKLILT